MNKIVLVVLSLLVPVKLVVAATIEDVCTKVTTLPDSDYIYKNSAPLRSGGVGTPLVGYRKEPTLIGEKRGSLSKGGTVVYDTAGTRIASCPWASAEDGPGGRYRCTIKTASLRKRAVTNTSQATIYFKLNGKACVKVPDAGRCYGSSKGLCNQLIK